MAGPGPIRGKPQRPPSGAAKTSAREDARTRPPSNSIASRMRNYLITSHHKRCGVLVLGLVIFFMLLPFVYDYPLARIALFGGYVALLVGVVWSIRRRGIALVVNISLGLIYFALIAAGILLHSLWMIQTGLAAAQFFLVGVMLALLNYVMDFSRVTADKLFGAVGIYILLAFLFSDTYLFIENFNPGNFNITLAVGERADWTDFIYFSFTVLTSTGFGEITPATRLARSIVIVQQVMGVMYVAFLIARLTELYPSRSSH